MHTQRARSRADPFGRKPLQGGLHGSNGVTLGLTEPTIARVALKLGIEPQGLPPNPPSALVPAKFAQRLELEAPPPPVITGGFGACADASDDLEGPGVLRSVAYPPLHRASRSKVQLQVTREGQDSRQSKQRPPTRRTCSTRYAGRDKDTIHWGLVASSAELVDVVGRCKFATEKH